MQLQLEKIPPVNYHTVIIGSGPIGLLSSLCALEVCDEGEKIALVADRLDELGLRQQILWIETDVFNFIEKMVGSELVQHYIESLAITQQSKKQGYFITTGDLERLFYDALRDQYEQGTDFDLIRSEKIGPGVNPGDKINVDTDRRTISIFGLARNDVPFAEKMAPTRLTLGFKFLISADGAKRNLVKTMGDEIVFDHTQADLFHTKHAVVTFQLPERTTPQDCYSVRVREGEKGAETLRPCPLDHLHETYGWQGYARPYSQVLATSDIIYIGTEIPSTLTDKGAIQKYALTMMGDLLPQEYIRGIRDLPCDLSTEWGRKKKLLSTSVFDIELGETNRTLSVCGRTEDEETTGVIFYMGDARKNPLYTTGSGVQTGIREVMCFATFLQGEDDLAHRLEQYHVETRVILDGIREKQDKWVSERNGKEGTALRNHHLFEKMKDNVLALDTLIKQMDQQLDSEESIPVSYQEIYKNLSEFKEKHKKLFDASQNEKVIYSYSDIDPKAMMADLKELRRSIRAVYIELLPHQALPAKALYDRFEDIATNLIKMDVEKASKLFFKENNTDMPQGEVVSLHSLSQTK